MPQPKEYKEFDLDSVFDYVWDLSPHNRNKGKEVFKQFIKENFIANSELREIVRSAIPRPKKPNGFGGKHNVEIKDPYIGYKIGKYVRSAEILDKLKLNNLI